MKKSFAILAGLSTTLIASAAMAGFTPIATEIHRFRSDAGIIVAKSQDVLNNARFVAAVQNPGYGFWRHHNWRARFALSKVRRLNESARHFLAARVLATPHYARNVLRQLERRFHDARRAFEWLRPTPLLAADFHAMGRALGDMKMVAQNLRPVVW
jgi:hypothetical protein